MKPEDFVRIYLESWERALGIEVGRARMESSIKTGKVDRRGAERNLDMDIIGAIGEVATCKVCGKFRVDPQGRRIYPKLSVNVPGERPDFGKLIQVKTRQRQANRLLIPPHSIDNHVFISTIQGSQFWTVCGWILAKDAKRDEWLEDPGGRGPAYFVPDEAVLPLSTIPADAWDGLIWP